MTFSTDKQALELLERRMDKITEVINSSGPFRLRLEAEEKLLRAEMSEKFRALATKAKERAEYLESLIPQEGDFEI